MHGRLSKTFRSVIQRECKLDDFHYHEAGVLWPDRFQRICVAGEPDDRVLEGAMRDCCAFDFSMGSGMEWELDELLDCDFAWGISFFQSPLHTLYRTTGAGEGATQLHGLDSRIMKAGQFIRCARPWWNRFLERSKKDAGSGDFCCGG